MTKPYLEVHIPISPTENFFNMIHYLVESFHQFGGELYNRTKFVITVGGDCLNKNLNKYLPWANDYNIEWRWLEKKVFNKFNYYATALQRFKYSFEADMVLMLDADIIITGLLDSIVERSQRTQSFIGKPAENHPFWRKTEKISPETWWMKVLKNAGFTPNDSIPPYFNLGFLLAPRTIMEKIGSTIFDEIEKVNEVIEVPTKCQIAVSLAMLRHHINCEEVNFKYNFLCAHPLQKKYKNITKKDLTDVKIWHYAGPKGQIQKQRDFLNPITVERFLRKKFSNDVSRYFQKKLKIVHEEIVRKGRKYE
jgi:lipopolysaccharide biosynthesis glycosyltransferase